MIRRLLLVGVAAVAGGACGGEIVPWESVDGGPWTCGDVDAAPIIAKGACNAEAVARCTAWAQSLVQGAYAHAECIPNAPEDVRCIPAVHCTNDPPGYGLCTCDLQTGELCNADAGEVCVSATPNGPAHCVAACTSF